MKSSIITLESQTYATMAKRLIAKSGINVRVVKLDGESGCTHGIEVRDFDLYSVYHILRNAEIQYSLYRGRV